MKNHPLKLFDSHCHLTYCDDIPGIVKECQEQNIGMITIGVLQEEWLLQQQFARTYDDVFYGNAIQPEYYNETLDWEALEKSLQDDKAVVVGETGIDGTYKVPILKQMEGLKQHIQSAIKLNLPISIHTRQAEKYIVDSLKPYISSSNITGVIHCFTGSLEFAKSMLDMGFYLSLSGILTFQSAKALQDVLSYIPLDRLLVETDSPWLAPIPMRGKPNRPAYVTHVVEKVCTLKNISQTKGMQQLLHNFYTLFPKIPKFLNQS